MKGKKPIQMINVRCVSSKICALSVRLAGQKPEARGVDDGMIG